MSSPKRHSNQYERKLARQRQLELMEAAASGVAPAMELDTSSLTPSTSTSLRSRSIDRGPRFHQEEEEVQFSSSPVRSSGKAMTGSLFDQRGRPDGLPLNTGLNLMDHETGIYQEQSKAEQLLVRLRAVFGGKRQNEGSQEVGDYLDYHRSSGKQRQASSTSFAKSLWLNKKRRYLLMLLLGIGIFIVAFTSVKASHGPSEKVLRQQNNKRFNSIMDTIVHEGISPASVFLDYTSAEHHALRWAAYSDPARLEVEDPMLLTRYALAVFFYNSFLTFEKIAGRQKPIEIGVKQWEGVPNPGWIRKDYWLTEKGVCMWYGVHCAALPQVDPKTRSDTQYDANVPVTAIKIQKNNIMGSLPAEFKALDELNLLDLMTNKVSGSFPAHMGRLFQLEYLHLSDNHMIGSLPNDIGFLESIKTLDLRRNAFTGPIPTELNRMFNLEVLQLSQNKFTGSIPSLKDLKSLEKVFLDHNELDKPFPYSLSMQLSLKELHLNNNKILGTLPGEIKSVRQLEKLRLEFNRMSGPVPSGVLSSLSHLREFNIDGNSFSGQFPSDLSSMRNLTIISAAENKLTGTLPPSMGHLTSLEKVHLNQNGLTKEIPWSFGNLTNIKELWLEGNKLKGQIPSQLSQCKKLETLYLDDNKLKGHVPSEFGKLTNLKTFRIQENDLSGDIPSQFCELKTFFKLTYFAADCVDEIGCDKGCCTECF